MTPKEELEEKQHDSRLETGGRWLSGELERGRKGISENLRKGSDSTGKLASPPAKQSLLSYGSTVDHRKMAEISTDYEPASAWAGYPVFVSCPLGRKLSGCCTGIFSQPSSCHLHELAHDYHNWAG